MVTARVLVVVGALAAVGCGVSNAERPFPPDAAPGAPGPAAGSADAAAAADAKLAADLAAPVDAAIKADSSGSIPDLGSADAAAAETPLAPPGGCMPVSFPACDAAPPDPGAKRPWRSGGPGLLAGGPRHRGRDLIITAGERQWLIAKFAYGTFDVDLVDEDVDLYLLRGCGGSWESLGTVRSNRSGGHPGADGVTDAAGRVFHELPASERLGPGRHRVRFVVAGDLSTTELFVEVLPAGTRLAIADVDGTLTPTETSEFGALLSGAVPAARPGAAAALTALAGKGYRPVYLSARPEWLVERTRQFLAERGFPAGTVRTTLGTSGALGGAAVSFKTAELAQLAGRGFTIAFAFGNTDTDAEAYANARIEPAARRIFLGYDDTRFGGRRIDEWTALAGELGALPAFCP